MSYKIAVASSNGENVNLSFGAAMEFIVYKVENNVCSFWEKRYVDVSESATIPTISSACENKEECSTSNGCENGQGVGCGDGRGSLPKIELLLDCRCIVCKKIGFHIQKQLERKAITYFDVTCSVEEALKKITKYFARVDEHMSLRGISKEN